MPIEPEIINPFIEREVFAEERYVYYRPQLFTQTQPPVPPIEVGEEEDGDDECGRCNICHIRLV